MIDKLVFIAHEVTQMEGMTGFSYTMRSCERKVSGLVEKCTKMARCAEHR